MAGVDEAPAVAVAGDSQDDSDASEKKFIRVGPEYQATPPPLQPSLPTSIPRSRPVWDPRACVLSSEQLNDFVQLAQASTTHKHGIDQILGLLYWNNFDTEATLQDLAQYCPHPEYDTKWSEERILAFETGLRQHGKRFHRVGERLPGISTRQIVLFYYRWKKTRKVHKEISELMEDREQPAAAAAALAAAPEPLPDDEGLRRRRARANGDVCANCGETERVSSLASGMLCPPCLAHWTTWGVDRETSVKRVKRLSPVEAPITASEVQRVLVKAEDPPQATALTRLEVEIQKADEAFVRARHSQASRSGPAATALARLTDPRAGRRTAKKRKGGKWDTKAAIAAFRRHGTDFEAVRAALDDVRPVNMIRNWYYNLRHKLSLDGDANGKSTPQPPI